MAKKPVKQKAGKTATTGARKPKRAGAAAGTKIVINVSGVNPKLAKKIDVAMKKSQSSTRSAFVRDFLQEHL